MERPVKQDIKDEVITTYSLRGVQDVVVCK